MSPVDAPPPSPPAGRARRVAAALAALAGGLAAWYLLAGRGALAEAVRANRRAILRNLLKGPGPYSHDDYLAAGDELVIATVIVTALTAGLIALKPRIEPWLARGYDAFQQWTPRLRSGWVPWALVIVGLVTAGLAVGTLETFPNSGDEACYLYQAETFSRGRVANAPHPLPEFFAAFHVRQVGDRVFSIFPPGWPALLSLALAAGAPPWIVNPLLGVALLCLTFVLARRLHDERVALVAAALVAVSPFFLFNAASYFAHTFCTVVILAFAYAGTRTLESGHPGWAAAAAACAGVGLLTRNYTAALCALPFVFALAARGGRGLRALAVSAAAGLPFAALALLYNAATTGEPLVFAQQGFESFDSQWFPDRWAVRGLEITGAHLARFTAWTPPALIAAYVWGWRTGRGRRVHFTDFLFPALVAGYFLHVNSGGNQYGPRFYHEAFPFVAMFAAAALLSERSFAEKSATARWMCLAVAASAVACVPIGWLHAAAESRAVAARAEPSRLAAQARLANAVVFVSTPAGARRPMAVLDLTRNDPDYANPVLFVHDRGRDNGRLMAFYPARTFWRYAFDPVARRGTLRRVAP